MDAQLPHADAEVAGVKEEKKKWPVLFYGLLIVLFVSGYCAAISAVCLTISLSRGENILSSCPGDPLLPSYILETGALAIIILLLAISSKVSSLYSCSQCVIKVMDRLMWILVLLYFCCTIAGCIWMFTKYADLFNPPPTSYCNSNILVAFKTHVTAFLCAIACCIFAYVLAEILFFKNK